MNFKSLSVCRCFVGSRKRLGLTSGLSLSSASRTAIMQLPMGSPMVGHALHTPPPSPLSTRRGFCHDFQVRVRECMEQMVLVAMCMAVMQIFIVFPKPCLSATQTFVQSMSAGLSSNLKPVMATQQMPFQRLQNNHMSSAALLRHLMLCLYISCIGLSLLRCASYSCL